VQIGVVYPQGEIGDPQAVAAFAQAAESFGYDHLVAYDHVLGAEHADRQPPLWGPYNETNPFHDPFVMFGYLAGITTRLEFCTDVLILPQRQTALVARQAADVDLLSGGRLRLGVATGWNYVEYDALGEDFETRGARLDEQIGLLRRLWGEPLVDWQGRFDRVDRACIVPRPTRQIPIWIGGFSDPAFRRAAVSGDGFLFAGDIDKALEGRERIRQFADAAGRDLSGFGWELTANRGGSPAATADLIEQWREAGGTHFTVGSLRNGFTSIEQHIDFINDAATRSGLAQGCTAQS
jgi:probable F420-dependent oxidoreductase